MSKKEQKMWKDGEAIPKGDHYYLKIPHTKLYPHNGNMILALRYLYMYKQYNGDFDRFVEEQFNMLAPSDSDIIGLKKGWKNTMQILEAFKDKDTDLISEYIMECMI